MPGMRDRYSSSARALILFSVVFLCLPDQLCSSQQTPQGASITIKVQADQSDGPLSPIWNYFGYDEPNYTYAPKGKKLLGETHSLLGRR
jgi:xylan 1,4-beta-xylosidase